MTGTGSKLRAPYIDEARGLAVLAMVFYHFCWDLSHFRLISADVSQDFGWRLFSKGIAGAFLFLVGVGLVLAHGDGVRCGAFLKRLWSIVVGACLVTATSYVAFPESYIFFGILHSIALGSVIGLVFLRWPPMVLIILAGVVFLLPEFQRWPLFNTRWLLWTGLGTEVPFTNDYEPIFPWFAYVLTGMALARMNLAIMQPRLPQSGLLALLGRWSLPIYLIHQPLLFGLFMLAFQLRWL